MIASERKLYILQQIHDRKIINLKDVARTLGTSEATIRRDLEKLEREGKLVRVQGGAALSEGTENLFDPGELSMSAKERIRHREKSAVAAAALAAVEVRDGQSIFLDCGTSVAPLADLLLGRRVHIVTYSTLVLQRAKRPLADLILVGGEYSAGHNMLTGSLAEKTLQNFHFDHAFIGCYGTSLQTGKCFQRDMASTNMKWIGMEQADRKYLLIDDSKLEKNGLYSFCDMTAFDRIFCNEPAERPEAPEHFCWVKI
ncbi:MAG: DeoR/GlpR transcriptional regulator [Lachnospiraceae bacterium]|nr:DeoR/GlpR transcriptional regulator [Lachnospiraceae bacterium]